MKQLWSYHAGVYNGLPVDDRTALEILSEYRPEPGEPRNRCVYHPGTAEIPESVAVNIRRRSSTIAAAVEVGGTAHATDDRMSRAGRRTGTG